MSLPRFVLLGPITLDGQICTILREFSLFEVFFDCVVTANLTLVGVYGTSGVYIVPDSSGPS